MGKKILKIILVFTALVGSIYTYFHKTPSELSHKECAFCNTEILNRQKFYEDDLVIALYTHKPTVPGHMLIIPKQHIERFEKLSDLEMVQIGKVIKKIDQIAMEVFKTSSYLLMQKNGIEVGQSVPHVHFHYIPKKKGDNAIIMFMAKMLIANMKKPISQNEMSEIIQILKDGMNKT